MSLIGLAFAVAATVLAFRRDFKEAAGVFAVGIVSVLLATPAGVSLLRDTVSLVVWDAVMRSAPTGGFSISRGGSIESTGCG